MKNYRYKERRNQMIRRVGFVVFEIAAAVLVAFLLIQFCFQVTQVYGESMQPTYYDGDTVLVNKLEYRMNRPKRLDVAVLELENGATTHYTVKRVIGLPGETVQITDGAVYIDGEKLDFSFEEEILSAGLAAYSIELGEDEYFVMGDNCNNSEDSRVANIGNIQKDQFVGRVMGRIRRGGNE